MHLYFHIYSHHFQLYSVQCIPIDRSGFRSFTAGIDRCDYFLLKADFFTPQSRNHTQRKSRRREKTNRLFNVEAAIRMKSWYCLHIDKLAAYGHVDVVSLCRLWPNGNSHLHKNFNYKYKSASQEIRDSLKNKNFYNCNTLYEFHFSKHLMRTVHTVFVYSQT